MVKKPEPSKEEILENITEILRDGEPPNKKPDEDLDKIIAELAKMLSKPPPPPEPKPDWVARVFEFLARLPVMVLTFAFMAATMIVLGYLLHGQSADIDTVIVFSISAVIIGSFGLLFSWEYPDKRIRRRRGRKLWRYALFTLVWAALIFAVDHEWASFPACAAFMLLMQYCLPWLAEKLYEAARRLVDTPEQAFRRLTGIYEPLELTEFVDPPKD